MNAVERVRTKYRAKRILRAEGLPERCERCGHGPGETSCGKVIHIELDNAWLDARAELEGERPEEGQEEIVDPEEEA